VIREFLRIAVAPKLFAAAGFQRYDTVDATVFQAIVSQGEESAFDEAHG
jgi:hypothetical protein